MVQADAQDHVGLLEEKITSASKSKLDEMLDHCINLYDESVEETVSWISLFLNMF